MSELDASCECRADRLGPAVKTQRQTARRALLDAFAELALSRHYQDVGVGLIVGKAGVARSTFYYHFKAKDDLLLQNLRPMMSALARLPVAAEPTQEVNYWVAHIWQHRARSRPMLEGATGRRIAEALALELQPALTEVMPDQAGSRAAPLLADQIAGSMLSLLRAWIAGRAAAAPSDIAVMLWSGARALADANGHTARVPARDRGSFD